MSPLPRFEAWDPSLLLRAQIEAGPMAPLLWKPNPFQHGVRRRWSLLLEVLQSERERGGAPLSPDPWFWLDPYGSPEMEANLREAAQVLSGDRTWRAGEQAAELVRQIPLFSRIRHHFNEPHLAEQVTAMEILELECERLLGGKQSGLSAGGAQFLLNCITDKTGIFQQLWDWRAWAAISAWRLSGEQSYAQQAGPGGGGDTVLEQIFTKMGSWPLAQSNQAWDWRKAVSVLCEGFALLGGSNPNLRANVLTAFTYRRERGRR